MSGLVEPSRTASGLVVVASGVVTAIVALVLASTSAVLPRHGFVTAIVALLDAVARGTGVSGLELLSLVGLTVTALGTEWVMVGRAYEGTRSRRTHGGRGSAPTPFEFGVGDRSEAAVGRNRHSHPHLVGGDTGSRGSTAPEWISVLFDPLREDLVRASRNAAALSRSVRAGSPSDDLAVVAHPTLADHHHALEQLRVAIATDVAAAQRRHDTAIERLLAGRDGEPHRVIRSLPTDRRREPALADRLEELQSSQRRVESAAARLLRA